MAGEAQISSANRAVEAEEPDRDHVRGADDCTLEDNTRNRLRRDSASKCEADGHPNGCANRRRYGNRADEMAESELNLTAGYRKQDERIGDDDRHRRADGDAQDAVAADEDHAEDEVRERLAERDVRNQPVPAGAEEDV